MSDPCDRYGGPWPNRSSNCLVQDKQRLPSDGRVDVNVSPLSGLMSVSELSSRNRLVRRVSPPSAPDNLFRMNQNIPPAG